MRTMRWVYLSLACAVVAGVIALAALMSVINHAANERKQLVEFVCVSALVHAEASGSPAGRAIAARFNRYLVEIGEPKCKLGRG